MDLILITLIILGIAFGGNRLRNKKLIPDIELLEASERFKDDLEHLKQQYIANTDLLNLKRTYLETAQ